MKEQLLRQLHSVKTMSIVGMCKNAGKTTMLNWLLEQGKLQGVLGLTSIGRDGESTDIVTGTEKPGIFVREGTLIATAKDMLRLGDITKEILMTTGIPTPLGEVVIVRARSAGHVQLAGPSITTQLKTVSKEFFDLGADISIIDGALGRKSLGARAVAEGVILCTGRQLRYEHGQGGGRHRPHLPPNEPAQGGDAAAGGCRGSGEVLAGQRRGLHHRRTDRQHGAAVAAQRRTAQWPPGGEGSQQGALKARHAGQAGYPQRYAGNGGGRPHPVRHHQPGIRLWLAL